MSLPRNSRHQDSNLLTSSSFHYTQKVLVSCQVEMFTVYKSCWPKVTTQLPLSRTCPLFQLSTIYSAERGPNIAVFWEDIEGKYCFSTLNCCTMIIFNFNSEPFHCVLLSLRYIIHSNPLFAHFVVLFKFSSLIIWKHSGYEFFSSQSIFAWSKLVNWNLRTSMEWYKKCILFYSGLQSFLGKHKTFMGSLTSMQYFHVD